MPFRVGASIPLLTDQLSHYGDLVPIESVAGKAHHLADAGGTLPSSTASSVTDLVFNDDLGPFKLYIRRLSGHIQQRDRTPIPSIRPHRSPNQPLS